MHVHEPTVDDSILILKGLRDRYESHHRAKIRTTPSKRRRGFSARYISDRHLPDKGIDLIDEAAARARINAMEAPESLRERVKKLEEVRREKEAAIDSLEFEKAALLRDDERRLSEELEEERLKWRSRKNTCQPVVTGEDIADVVAEWTGIPVFQLTGEESERLLRMEEEIGKRLIGQGEAVASIARAIRRARSGLKDPARPIGSFVLLGPTGVGKTELARQLADFLFGSRDKMIRLDMSEFMEKHEVSKLIGAPGLRGLRGGRKIDRSRQEKALLGNSVRRD